MDKAKVNAFYGSSDMEFSTTSLASAFPLLKDKFGAGKAVALNISASNATVEFGRYDADLTVNFV